MMQQEKIASSQMAMLLVTVVSATAFLFAPAVTSQDAGRDGWVSVLVVATGFGLLVNFISATLGLRFQNHSVIEYAPQVMGKWLGKLIGFMYIIFFIHVNAIIVREFGDFLVAAFLPETPLFIFNLVAILLAASIVRNGLEVLARMNQFLFPMFFAVILGIIVLNIGNLRIDNLFPLFENGYEKILLGSLTPNAWRGEVILILIFLPYLNKPAEVKKSLNIAVLIIGILVTLLIVASTMVFGSYQDSRFVFPTLQLAKYVSIGGFLERIEAMVVIVWVAGITIKVAAFYLATVISLAQFLNLKSYQPLVYPIGIITLIYSLILFDDSDQLVRFLAEVFPFYSYTFQLIIPFLLLITAVMRKKGGQGQ